MRTVPIAAGMGAVPVSEPCGLDFTAVMTMGAALGADLEMLADALPGVEQAILLGLNDNSEDEEE